MSIWYKAMLRRETRKVNVEMARYARSGAKRQHLPLFAVLFENRMNARPGIRRWKVR